MDSRESQLEQLWVHRLRRLWQERNQSKLSGRLKMPAIRIGEGVSTLGQFDQASRTVTIARRHVLDAPWEEVEQTFLHEMAHQVVCELLQKPSAAPHGVEFQEAEALLGVERAATLLAPAEERLLRRAEKLLALANSTNEHEAHLAMKMANNLLLKHNLEHVVLEKSYIRTRVGDASARVPVDWKVIGGILSSHFFVECIWVRVFCARSGLDKRRLELLGTPGNVAIAHHVHDFLHTSVERLVRERKRAGRRISREFRFGVVTGFKAQLEEAERTAQEEGLVWAGDPGLQNFLKTHYPRTGSLRGNGVHASPELSEGQKAGKKLIWNRPIGTQRTGRSPEIPGKTRVLKGFLPD